MEAASWHRRVWSYLGPSQLYIQSLSAIPHCPERRWGLHKGGQTAFLVSLGLVRAWMGQATDRFLPKWSKTSQGEHAQRPGRGAARHLWGPRLVRRHMVAAGEPLGQSTEGQADLPLTTGSLQVTPSLEPGLDQNMG